jgi:hypothetical protein
MPVTIAFASLASLASLASCLDEPSEAALGVAEAREDVCPWAPTVALTPSVIPPTRVGVPVVFAVAVTNPNAASCEPLPFQLDVLDTGLLLDPRPALGAPPPTRTLASGATAHFTVTATAPASADAGDTLELAVAVTRPLPAPPPGPPGPPGPSAPPVPPQQVVPPPVAFSVAATPGCQISAARELMITNVSVVDDPVRTGFDPRSSDPRNGVWTFKHLVENMARTPADAAAMVEEVLSSFSTPRTINGFTVAARPGLQSQILAKWPRTATGALDLARAPVRLLAIVNRVDLRDLARGDAGEGRFVFSFNLESPPPPPPPAPPAPSPAPPAPPAPPPEATIIFEYKLPAAHERDVARWADAFHALGRLPFGERYNAALQEITERFVHRGARPGYPNGSAIAAVRTNEIPFGDNNLWELREFYLSRRSGRLEPAALAQTPDLGFNDSATLASYINANQAQIIAETHTVPDRFQWQPFKAGAVFNDLDTWFTPGVDPEARHHFAINTCNGCHAARETHTGFLHLAPRAPGAESRRSRWLTGAFVDDPETGEERAFDELGRRKADSKSIVCRGAAAPSLDTLRKGTSRVH